MTVIVVQVGNQKLTQGEWAGFISAVRNRLSLHIYAMQFCGGSDWDAYWQNACFVCEIPDEKVDTVKNELAILAASYKQDAIAVIVGQTECIKPKKGGE